jgi:hypothetical protein
MKKLLLLVLVFLTYLAKSQLYKGTDFLKLLSINPKNDKLPTILIVLPEEDCYKCRLPVYRLLEVLKKENLEGRLTLIALTNNYVLCKDFFSDRTDIRIIASKPVTKKLASDNKTSFYLIDTNNAVYKRKVEETDAVIKQLKLNKPTNQLFTIADSVFSNNLMMTSNSKDHLIFEEALQKGMIINNKLQRYYEVDFKEKASVLRLPADKKIDTNTYKRVDADESEKMLKLIKLPFVRLQSIRFLNDSIVYSRISINNCYYNLTDSSNMAIISTQLIAILNTAQHAEDVNYFDLSSYDQYFCIDSVNVSGKPLFTAVGYPESVSKGNTICFKMDTMDYKNEQGYYFGIVKAVYKDYQLRFEQQEICTSIPSEMPFIYSTELNRFVTLSSSNTINKVSFKGNTILLSRKFGYRFLYEPSITEKGMITIFYSTKSSEVWYMTVDAKNKKVIADTRFCSPPLPFYLTIANKKIYSVYKKMINADYNYGTLIVKEMSLPSL